jgi:LacI family transcriptional regulator
MMTGMGATQKTIADRLGISRSLVSRALTGSADEIRANRETVRRIRDEARRLGYRPNAVALALRGHSTRTIGVLVKDFADPFFGRMLSELDHLARRSGFSLVMSGLEQGRRAAEDSALLAKYRPDGLLLVGSDFFPDEVGRYAAAGVDVVRLGSGRAADGIAQVAMDEVAGMALLVVHLLELGHERVGYLAAGNARCRRRVAALNVALARAGLAAADVARRGEWADSGWIGRLRRDRGAPTVWVAFDDLAAIHALHAWRDAGVDVPGFVSIAGVDDIAAAELIAPALTTLRQPVHALVRAAFRMLVAPAPAANEWIVPELVVRASCAPCRREMTLTTRSAS